MKIYSYVNVDDEFFNSRYPQFSLVITYQRLDKVFNKTNTKNVDCEITASLFRRRNLYSNFFLMFGTLAPCSFDFYGNEKRFAIFRSVCLSRIKRVFAFANVE